MHICMYSCMYDMCLCNACYADSLQTACKLAKCMLRIRHGDVAHLAKKYEVFQRKISFF